MAFFFLDFNGLALTGLDVASSRFEDLGSDSEMHVGYNFESGKLRYVVSALGSAEPLWEENEVPVGVFSPSTGLTSTDFSQLVSDCVYCLGLKLGKLETAHRSLKTRRTISV